MAKKTMKEDKDSSMKTVKKLRRLGRADLLAIIYRLEEELEAQKKENETLLNKLNEQNFDVKHIGSIEEASAAVTSVLESTRHAVNDYLKNIKKLGDDAMQKIMRANKRADAIAEALDKGSGKKQ